MGKTTKIRIKSEPFFFKQCVVVSVLCVCVGACVRAAASVSVPSNREIENIERCAPFAGGEL